MKLDFFISGQHGHRHLLAALNQAISVLEILPKYFGQEIKASVSLRHREIRKYLEEQRLQEYFDRISFFDWQTIPNRNRKSIGLYDAHYQFDLMRPVNNGSNFMNSDYWLFMDLPLDIDATIAPLKPYGVFAGGHLKSIEKEDTRFQPNHKIEHLSSLGEADDLFSCSNQTLVELNAKFGGRNILKVDTFKQARSVSSTSSQRDYKRILWFLPTNNYASLLRALHIGADYLVEMRGEHEVCFVGDGSGEAFALLSSLIESDRAISDQQDLCELFGLTEFWTEQFVKFSNMVEENVWGKMHYLGSDKVSLEREVANAACLILDSADYSVFDPWIQSIDLLLSTGTPIVARKGSIYAEALGDSDLNVSIVDKNASIREIALRVKEVESGE